MAPKKKPTEDETPVDAVAADEAVAAEDATEGPAVEDTAAEVAAEEPAAETEREAEIAAEPEPEVVAEEPAAEEPPAEELAAEAVAEPEPVADEPAAVEPETEVASEAPAPAAEPAPAAAPVQQSGPKLKKKRLPRALRPKKGRVVREKAESRKPIVRLEKPEHERGRSQERQGTVVSNAMEKTIVVKVDTIKAHRKYQKVVRRSNTFHAHDERNEAKVGDVVRIVETRPLSKTKRWRLAEIVEAAK